MHAARWANAAIALSVLGLVASACGGDDASGRTGVQRGRHRERSDSCAPVDDDVTEIREPFEQREGEDMGRAVWRPVAAVARFALSFERESTDHGHAGHDDELVGVDLRHPVSRGRVELPVRVEPAPLLEDRRESLRRRASTAMAHRSCCHASEIAVHLDTARPIEQSSCLHVQDRPTERVGAPLAHERPVVRAGGVVEARLGRDPDSAARREQSASEIDLLSSRGRESLNGVTTPTSSGEGRGRCTISFRSTFNTDAAWLANTHTASTHSPRSANGAANRHGRTRF